MNIDATWDQVCEVICEKHKQKHMAAFEKDGPVINGDGARRFATICVVS